MPLLYPTGPCHCSAFLNFAITPPRLSELCPCASFLCHCSSYLNFAVADLVSALPLLVHSWLIPGWSAHVISTAWQSLADAAHCISASQLVLAPLRRVVAGLFRCCAHRIQLPSMPPYSNATPCPSVSLQYAATPARRPSPHPADPSPICPRLSCSLPFQCAADRLISNASPSSTLLLQGRSLRRLSISVPYPSMLFHLNSLPCLSSAAHIDWGWRGSIPRQPGA